MFQRTLLAFAAVLGLSQVAHAQTAVGPAARSAHRLLSPAPAPSSRPARTFRARSTPAPAGTTFCLAAGTYTNQYVEPKADDTFIGAVGTILDGRQQDGP